MLDPASHPACSDTAAGADAQLLVPRALGLLAGSPQAPRDEWAAGWGRVPLHVLLPWGAQMLSLLDGLAGDALLPTLKVTPPRCPTCHGSRAVNLVGTAWPATHCCRP